MLSIWKRNVDIAPGGGVAAAQKAKPPGVAGRRQRDAMVDLALGSHPSHSGEKAHKVGVACKKSCSQNIAWPRRRRPRPAKHLPPSSGGTVAALAAVWWRRWRRRPQNIITLTFITLFSVVVSPTMYVPQSAIYRPRLHCRHRAAAFARAAI